VSEETLLPRYLNKLIAICQSSKYLSSVAICRRDVLNKALEVRAGVVHSFGLVAAIPMTFDTTVTIRL
jgi:hypothetical protein